MIDIVFDTSNEQTQDVVSRLTIACTKLQRALDDNSPVTEAFIAQKWHDLAKTSTQKAAILARTPCYFGAHKLAQKG